MNMQMLKNYFQEFIDDKQHKIMFLNREKDMFEEFKVIDAINLLEEKDKEIERLQDMDKILRNENLKLKLIIATAIRIYEDCAETQDYSTCDLDMYEVLKGVYNNEQR